MVEPVSVTLAVVALLFPIYDDCNRLYHGYSLTRSFGSDFQLVQFQLDAQWCRLDEMLRRRLVDLETPIQINDPKHPHTGKIIMALSLMKRQFDLANKLMEKYAAREKVKSSAQNDIVAFPAAHTLSSTTNTSSHNSSLLPEVGAVSSSSTSITTHITTNIKQAPKDISRTSIGTGSKKGTKWPFHRKKATNKPTQPKSAQKDASSVTSSTHASNPQPAQKFLDSQLVMAMGQEQEQQRQDLMAHTSFFRKAAWVKADQDALKQIIKNLKHLNNSLDTLVILRLPQNPATSFALVEAAKQKTAPWLSQALITQRILMRLHDSLRHMNTPGNGHQSWHINIKLAVDFKDSRSIIVNNLYGQTLRNQEGAYYFNLRRQLQASQDEATLFIAESMPISAVNEASTPESNAFAPAWHLDRPDGVEKGPLFNDWGTIWTEANRQDIHRLFHAENQISHALGTLPEILKSEHAAEMTPIQRVNLAHLIAISYVHFSLVRQSCNDTQPSSFCYYSASQQKDAWMDSDLPIMIMKPYLNIGFGQIPPIILEENIGFSHNTLIFGLGVLLFQIGCNMEVPYNISSQGLLDAKKKVFSYLDLLDRRVTPAFTEVTQACLQFTSASVRRDGYSIDEFLEGVVSRLLSLQDSFS